MTNNHTKAFSGIAILLALIFSPLLHAQSNAVSDDLDRILRQKDSLINEGLEPEALELMIKSQQLAYVNSNPEILAEIAISIVNLKAQLALTKQKPGQTDLTEVRSAYDSLLAAFEENPQIGALQTSEVYISLAQLASQDARDTTQIPLLYKALGLLTEDTPEQMRTKARIYYALAHLKLTRQGNRIEAAHYYTKSLRADSLASKSDIVLRAENYRSLGLVAYYEGQGAKTQAYLKKAMSTLAQAPDHAANKTKASFTLSLMLAAQARRNQQPDSIVHWGKQAVTVLEDMQRPPPGLLSQAYNNLSGNYFLKGDYVNANEFADKALEIRRKILSPDHPSMANSYSQKANAIAAGFGQYDKARALYEEAYRIAEKNYPPYHPTRLTYITNLVYVYNSMRMYEKSLEIAKKGLHIALGPEKKENFDAARHYQDLGSIFSHLGDSENSFAHYAKALEIYTKFLGANHYEVATIHYEIGENHYLNRAYDKSISSLEKAMNIFEAGKMTRNIHFVKLLDALSRNHLEKGQLALADKYISASIETNLRDSGKAAELHSLSVDDVLYSQLFIEEIIIKGYLEHRKYLKTGDIEYLNLAQKYFSKSQSLINELLLKGTYQADQLNLIKIASPVAPLGTMVSAELLQADQSPEAYDNLFQFMESSRAITLKMVGLKNANLASNAISEDLTNLESLLRTRIVRKQGEITNAYLQSNRQEADRLQGELFLIRQSRDSLVEVIKTTHPRLYSLSFESLNLSLDEVQMKLGSDQMIVMYQRAENTLFTLLIEQDKVSLEKTPVTNDFDSLLVNFSKHLLASDTEAFQSVSNQLSTILLSPVKDQIKGKSLIIAPDGLMWNIHFDLLKTPDTNDYLLQQNAISYAYSVNLLFQPKEKKQNRAKMLAFSFDNGQEAETSLSLFRNSSVSNLPGTVEELKSIAALISGDYLYGNQASEANFKDKAPNADVLHLALHGKVDDQNPDNSKLFFSKTNRDSLEDGNLYPFELYEMNLNAQLAVLSACETGSGKILNGEGIMSLGRAFQYAGVNSLVLSQWEVSDAATPEIMESFYAHLKQGMPKDEALRQAKLSFLENANNVSANPLYWGSFFILGNPDPINLADKGFASRYWLLMILLTAMVFYIAVRIRKRKVISS
ncbi:MAG: hypothetical protein Roseis2KO_17890 [Roseivirga sp.]